MNKIQTKKTALFESNILKNSISHFDQSMHICWIKIFISLKNKNLTDHKLLTSSINTYSTLHGPFVPNRSKFL